LTSETSPKGFMDTLRIGSYKIQKEEGLIKYC